MEESKQINQGSTSDVSWNLLIESGSEIHRVEDTMIRTPIHRESSIAMF